MVKINGISYKSIKLEEYNHIKNKIKVHCENNKNYSYCIWSFDGISRLKLIQTKEEELVERKEVLTYEGNKFFINLENIVFLYNIMKKTKIKPSSI